MIENIDFEKGMFGTKAENEQAAKDLEAMTQTAGWKFLEKVVQLSIDQIESALLGEGEAELSEKDREVYQYRRKDLKKLLNLPKMQIKKLQGEEVDPRDDPYATAHDISEENGKVPTPEETD